MNSYDSLIIGLGPCGQAVGLQLGHHASFRAIEACPVAGGLASSTIDAEGFTWDLGSHLQFSHFARYDELLDSALTDEEWLFLERSTWVWFPDGFVPFPFQLNLHRLSPQSRWKCVAGLLNREHSECPGSFYDWIDSTLGEGIAELFMQPYNEKIWATPLKQMSAGWIADRVAVPKLHDVLKGICLEQDSTTWGPNARFRYPRRGGTGAIWNAVARQLPAESVAYGERVTRIDIDRHIVETDQGNRFRYGFLVSTLPLDVLANVTNEERLAKCKKLRATQTHVIGIGIEGQPPEDLRDKLWLYFPQADLPFYRVTVMSNLSPENTPRPGKRWSLMVEIAESDFRPPPKGNIVDATIRGLKACRFISNRDVILSRWHRKLSHGYPVPTLDRDEILDDVLPWLCDKGIYSRGRFGAWKYEVSNQDHSFMQGVEAVEHILHGREELTVFKPDLVNSRHNEWPYPEWVEAKRQQTVPCPNMLDVKQKRVTDRSEYPGNQQ